MFPREHKTVQTHKSHTHSNTNLWAAADKAVWLSLAPTWITVKRFKNTAAMLRKIKRVEHRAHLLYFFNLTFTPCHCNTSVSFSSKIHDSANTPTITASEPADQQQRQTSQHVNITKVICARKQMQIDRNVCVMCVQFLANVSTEESYHAWKFTLWSTNLAPMLMLSASFQLAATAGKLWGALNLKWFGEYISGPDACNTGIHEERGWISVSGRQSTGLQWERRWQMNP